MVKGIDQDEVIAFFCLFLEELLAILARHNDAVIFRQAKKTTRQVYDMGGIVDGIDSALVEMVRKKMDKRAASNADNEDILWFRHHQEGRKHMLGIGEQQVFGVG